MDAPRDRSYTVEIKPGILADIPVLLSRSEGKRRMFIITDANVTRHYGRTLEGRLSAAGCEVTLFDVPAGERSKGALTVNRLYTKLFRGGIRRDSLVIALGGGVVGDLAGYLAATALRGVRLIQIPTSLLAQVDSSVGGKVGIDHPAGKNLIGAFHQPAAVYIDPDVLSTLPADEFRNGFAEVIKIAAALDAPFFSMIERNVSRIRKDNTDLNAKIVETAVALKASVVEKDERETGLRRVLNLGHTIGHALESSGGYALKHGHAVAMGMAAEARMSVELGLLSAQDCRRLTSLLEASGLPAAPPEVINERAFLSAIALDKKSDVSGPRFVLLRRIGECATAVPVPPDLIRKTMGLVSTKSKRG
jgi:3-dehydroquinate synthase